MNPDLISNARRTTDAPTDREASTLPAVQAAAIHGEDIDGEMALSIRWVWRADRLVLRPVRVWFAHPAVAT